MRLIDADALKDNVEKYRIVHLSHRRLSAIKREAEEVINDICFAIDVAPIIDPVRHGKWIDDCTCSVCHWIHEDGEGFALLTNYPFCPNCGVKMDEVEK